MGQKDTYVSSLGWPGQEEIQIAAVREQSRYSPHSPALPLWEGDGGICKTHSACAPFNPEHAGEGTAASHHIPQGTKELP